MRPPNAEARSNFVSRPSIAHRREAALSSRDILAHLVSMPTVSRSSNADLIDYASEVLLAAGFEILHVEAGAGRRNLFASAGPRDRDGVVLSGHTDVVPVEGQTWASDPYTLVERDGLLYGRGAADMKGFVACVLHAARSMDPRDLKWPLHIALSCDEEIGCVGVRPLLDYLRDRKFTAALCIVGEPTSMRVATSHKGKLAARATCIGREAHSALAPQGLNAVHLASELVLALRDLQSELRSLTTLEDLFDLPYSTVHVGLITGGVALNIVPARCTVDFEIRNLPTMTTSALLDRIENAARQIVARCSDPDANIVIEVVNAYPGLHTPRDDISETVSLLGGNDRVGLSFGAEAGLFRETLGCPTIVCGPGSMDQGHKPDEFIALDQLRRCDIMLQRLLQRMSIDRPL